MFSITNWIYGSLIGLLVCLVLVLLLHFTAFRNMNMKILYVIMFILFGVAGGFLQYHFCSSDSTKYPTPQDQVQEINKTIVDNWKNTNGGFTFEQIKKSQDDNECPSYDDQIIDLKCYDFGSYIVFGYKNNQTYENVLFYKSNAGLILDGMINTYASLSGMKWFFAYDLDTFSWVFEKDKEPYYSADYTFFDWHKFNGTVINMVSVSKQNLDFVKWTHELRTNQDEMIRFVTQNAVDLTGKNATSHFIKFGDVELIGSDSTGFMNINSFYNYLYEQIKGEKYNTTKLIDSTNSLCLPIPQAEQNKYPISASKKAEYDNADYYGVYKTNIAVNLSWVKGNETVTGTTKNDDYIKKIKEDDNTKDLVDVKKLTPNYSFSKVDLSFIDTNNSDLSNVNLLNKPVTITFTCSDKNQTKTVLIDSLNKLNKNTQVLLSKNTVWNYVIDSEALIFDNFRGSFTIKSNSNHISFPYYYLNNYTVASVGLNAVGTVDKSTIDLQANPVKIILANDNHSYQFVFDDNSKLDSYQSMLVELGEYTYTILSKQLEFASVTGKLTITSKDKVMLFNYAVTKYNTDLSFNINVEEYSSAGKLYLYSDSSNVDIIRNTLSSAKVYTVTVVIYDQDGRLLHTFNHTHQNSGACSDYWSMNNLTNGATYTLQLRFADRDDLTKTYLSDVTDFVYKNTTGFRVVYNTIKNT